MAYTIEKTNNTILTIIEDGTIDNTTDLKLVGKNYSGYGEIQNENFVSLLENFASANQPPRPVAGQLWFDTDDEGISRLKVYDGNANKFFNPLANLRIGVLPGSPSASNVSKGDLWYDDVQQQLHVYNGSAFVLVGPKQASANQTEWVETLVYDNLLSPSDTTAELKAPHEHYVLKGVVNNKVMFIASKDAFTLDNSNTIVGFNYIHQGITLVDSNDSTGVQNGVERFHGTSSNTDRLGGTNAVEFVQRATAVFTDRVDIADADGLRIGGSNEFTLNTSGGNAQVTHVTNGGLIKLIAYDGTGTQKTPLIIDPSSTPASARPDGDGVYNLGTSGNRWNTVHAINFTGTSEKSDLLKVGVDYRSASTAATANTIVARDSSADVYANYFRGTATNADLAVNATNVAVDGVSYATGSASATASSVAVRDASGNLTANQFNGIATRAATLQVGSENRSSSVTAVADTVAVRDNAGSLIASTFYGALSGTAALATKWAAGVTLNFTGDATGSTVITGDDGTLNVALTSASNSIALGTDTTGNYVERIVRDTGETYVNVTVNNSINPSSYPDPAEGATIKLGVNAASANTASYLVARDSSGDFAGNVVTATKFVGDMNEANTTKDGFFDNLTVGGTLVASTLNLAGASGTLAIAQGGTAGTTAAAARTNLDVYAKSETYSQGEIDSAISSGVGGVSTTSITNGSSNVSVTTSGGNTVVTRAGATHASFTANGLELSVGTFVGNLTGNAVTANYADLAEKYTTNEIHPTGTIMAIGAQASFESERCVTGAIPMGVISANPAFLMNAEADGQALALKGRVPVLIKGSVSKGQAVYVHDNGYASTEYTGQQIVGVALVSSEHTGIKLVECMLKL